MLCDPQPMRVLVIGGTWFLGRRIVERLRERGDEVLVVHRGRNVPDPWVPVGHLLTDRRDLARHRDEIRSFDPQAVIDAIALTGADVDAVVPVLPEVPTVVLSSQDVYEAHTGLRSATSLAAVPLTEDSELRRVRYPYKGLGIDVVPDDYDKLDVEERVLPADLAIAAAPAQHLLASVARAQALLDWSPGDPAARIAESVRWHREHPPNEPNLVRGGRRHRRRRPRGRSQLELGGPPARLRDLASWLRPMTTPASAGASTAPTSSARWLGARSSAFSGVGDARPMYAQRA